MAGPRKISLLFSLLLPRPGEFFDRVRHILEVKIDRSKSKPYPYAQIIVYETAVREILFSLNDPDEEIPELRVTGGLAAIEAHVNSTLGMLQGNVPFRTTHSADPALARLCYFVCRVMKPEVVIETGVAYGVTSAYILQALQENGKGELHSIDLPPLGQNVDEYVGALIPSDLKNRWSLHRGSARHLLPEVLKKVGQVDIFLHDSLHTYGHMLWEFTTVLSKLRPGGVLLSDDIAENKAFHDWVEMASPEKSLVIRKLSSEGLIGFAQKMAGEAK